MSIKENKMKLKDLLKESMVWERNFGEPLPTLDSVMEKYQQEGGKGSGRKPEKGSAKDIEKKSMKAADDANAKMDADEKEMERQAKAQAMADMGMDDDDMFESFLKENPAAVAAATAAMVQMKAQNPSTGRVNKMTTALGNKSHPSHKKAKGIFARLVDKFKKKKAPLSKADQYKAFMKKTSGESITVCPSDVKDARKALSMVVKQEQKFRKQMLVKNTYPVSDSEGYSANHANAMGDSDERGRGNGKFLDVFGEDIGTKTDIHGNSEVNTGRINNLKTNLYTKDNTYSAGNIDSGDGYSPKQ